jgi:hypothetical protein
MESQAETNENVDRLYVALGNRESVLVWFCFIIYME